MTLSPEFWNALAPVHARIENSYLDLASARRLLNQIREPALIVGAGQGLIVAELRKQGLRCDGVDISPEMLRYAKIRRGLDLIEADAKALPFKPGSYRTIIYATGVVDFTGDEQEIGLILREARRVVDRSGTVFVAFYRLSPATEQFMVRLGLLRENVLCHRDAMTIQQLNGLAAIAWVAERAKVSYGRALVLSLRAWAFSTWQEKRNAFHMHKILGKEGRAEAIMRTLPEQQPYRNAVEIRQLFGRLANPIKKLSALNSCYIVEI